MPASVLVVDDNLKIQKMLGDLFSFDFDVVGLASDGQEAMEKVTGADPDVVVVDYMMPGLDGIETARSIRDLRPHQQIILYTAFLDGEIYDRAKGAGVAECVTKTDGPIELEKVIRRLTGATD